MTNRSVVQELKEALSICASAQAAMSAASRLETAATFKTTAARHDHRLLSDSTSDQLSQLLVKLSRLLESVTTSQPQPSNTLESAGLHHKMIEWEDSSSPCCGQTAAKVASSCERFTQPPSPSPSPTSPDPVVCHGFWDGKMWFRDSKGRLGWSRISSPRCACGRKVCQP